MYSINVTNNHMYIFGKFVFYFCTFVAQLLSNVQLSVTLWTAAHQDSQSFTISPSLLKLMSVESEMLSNHLILCRPLLLLPSIFPSIWVFTNESALHIRWPKYWSFSFSLSPSAEYSRLISFRINWFDLLAVQGLSRVFSSTTVQKHQFFSTQPSSWFNSHPYMTIGKTIALTIQIIVSKMMALVFNKLSRFVITFFPKSKCLLISWMQSLATVILEFKKIKSATASTFSLLFAMKWWNWMPWS